MNKLQYSDVPAYIPEKKFRVSAFIIDYLIYGALFITATLVCSFTNCNSTIDFVIYIFLWLILFPIGEGITGRTIGKKIMHLKVVQIDFTKTNLSTSFIRHLFDIIDLQFLGILGLLIMNNNKYNRRLGDLIALTIVVKDYEELPETDYPMGLK